MRYINILCGYRDGVVEFLYEGSIPPRRHIARISGDQLGLDVGDVRPSCVFDEALIRQYQEAWAHLPRPWIVANRKPNRCQNKGWMGVHWGRLIASLLNWYTVVEIRAGRDGGDPVRHPYYVDLSGRLPLDRFFWPPSPQETSTSARSPGRCTSPPRPANRRSSSYSGYEHPDCSSYPENINIYTALPCSPCWLLQEPCPYDRVCLSRISPERVEVAIASLARVGPWGVHDPLEQMRVTTRAAHSRRDPERRTPRHDRLPRRIR